MSFSMTILLTLSVYMTLISDHIPHNSDPVAILTISLFIKMIICGLITLSVCFVGNIYKLEGKKPFPKCIERCFIFRKSKLKIAKQSEVCPADLMNEYEEATHWLTFGKMCDNLLLVVFIIVIVTEIACNTYRIQNRVR